MRMIAEFEKCGPASFISHLDLQRVVGRALRRAKLPISYSQGFNPHPLLSFASALPVGCESVCEIMDVTMEEEVSGEAYKQSLNAVLPRGLAVTRAKLVGDGVPSPMAIIGQAVYRSVFDRDVSEQVANFVAAEEVTAIKKSKKKEQEVNIRPMVYHMEMVEGAVVVRVRHDNAVSLKPGLLFSAMGLGEHPALRIELLTAEGKNLFDELGE